MEAKIPQSFINGENQRPLKIAIIGGGLVGSLAALHLGRKGHDIHLYEYREDIRRCELVQGRSINLALSIRGRAALAEVGLEERLLKHGIPMKGRMLHDLNGKTTFVPYDAGRKECIYSVGRKHLNEVLLTEAPISAILVDIAMGVSLIVSIIKTEETEKYPNIHRYFNQKLIKANLDEGRLHFKNPKRNEESEAVADLIVGCDGAYSAVRRQMLSKPGFNFSQTYIEHGYLELCIPPKYGEFAMPHNYLHIWPRGKFMMIALPNQDKTWTVTLFMPFENFSKLKTSDALLEFFEEHFPDAIPLIGTERLIKDFFKSKPQHLVSVKCNPYHVGSKVLLLGDAAHAMVPFYGQGMNAGFEDCSILSTIMNKPSINIQEVLREFSEIRWEHAHAICDLAMYNYIEMRDLVTKKSFRIRKAFDDFLYRLMPNFWVPLYNSVSFSRMPYKQCIENRKWQDKILKRTFLTICALAGFAIITLFVIKN